MKNMNDAQIKFMKLLEMLNSSYDTGKMVQSANMSRKTPDMSDAELKDAMKQMSNTLKSKYDTDPEGSTVTFNPNIPKAVIKKEGVNVSDKYPHLLVQKEKTIERAPHGFLSNDKKLRKYPFIDGKKVREDFGSVIGSLFKYYITEAAYQGFNVEANAQTGNVGWKIIDGIMTGMKFGYKGNYQNKLPDMFPKIAVWKRFADSSTNIGKLYTVEMSGFEFPVYITDNAGKLPDPSTELLSKNIDEIAETGKSPYNGIEEMNKFYNSSFSRLAAGKFTRGDFESSMLEDPRQFRKWLMRDQTWLIQQYGNVVDEMIVTLEHGAMVKVRVYDSTDSLSNWLFWFVGDQIYDLIDAPLDPLQRKVEEYSRDAGQIFLKTEYKAISGITRSFFTSGRLPLLYDLTDLPKNMVPDITMYR